MKFDPISYSAGQASCPKEIRVITETKELCIKTQFVPDNMTWIFLFVGLFIGLIFGFFIRIYIYEN